MYRGIITPGSPVNRASPLNRGLVSWWLNLPNRLGGGGSTFRDLMGRNHGTLTNGPTWQGSRGRPGGFGSVRFDGSDDYVTIPDAAPLDCLGYTVGYTIAFWMQRLTHDTNDAPFCKRAGVATGDVGISSMMTDGGDILRITASDGVTSREAISTTVFNTAEWKHILFSIFGGRGKLYVNGKLEFDDGWSDIDDCSNTSPLLLGINPASSSPLNGCLDDFRVFQGGKSADEASRIYNDSRRGSIETLNWQRRTVVVDMGGGGGGGFSPYWAVGSNVLIQPAGLSC